MCMEEIIGVVIDSRFVTNDPDRIDAALLSAKRVQYISRRRARLLAFQTRRPQWDELAKAPVIFTLVDGVRYRVSHSGPPINFSVSTSPTTASQSVQGSNRD